MRTLASDQLIDDAGTVFSRSYITFDYREMPRRTDLAVRKAALAEFGRQMRDYKRAKPISAQHYSPY